MTERKESKENSESTDLGHSSRFALFSLFFVAIAGVVFYLFLQYRISAYPAGDKWMEKVKLASGEVLLVKREKRYGNSEFGTGGGPLIYASLEFDYRGKTYKWESGNSSPSLLEIDKQGRPVVAGSIGYDWAWLQRGKPCDRLFVEYFDGDEWILIPSWEIPVSTRLNLAADKVLGEQGIARADHWAGPTHGDYSYYKEQCSTTGGAHNVR